LEIKQRERELSAKENNLIQMETNLHDKKLRLEA